MLGGKEIQRYFIRGIKGVISKQTKISNEADIKDNSILLQRIIAHIENPTPHIKFIATITSDKSYKIVNTIFQIICNDNVSNKYILGILHSKFINWYCYRFAFVKAIRSMDFSNEIAKRIPIPKITKANQTIVNEIIALVDEILNLKANCHSEPALAGEETLSKELRDSQRDVSGIRPQHDKIPDTSKLESQIDKLVYKLYNLSENEIKIIESK